LAVVDTSGVVTDKDREEGGVGGDSTYDEMAKIADDVVGGEDITGVWEVGVCVDA
jgi:hypothetical protein